MYTDLSGGTKRFPLFCLALLLAAIWLIMAAIFSSENFCYSDTQKSWQTTEVFLISSSYGPLTYKAADSDNTFSK